MRLTMILLLGVGLLFGCSKSSTPDEQDTPEIRQPVEGEDVGESWDANDWTNLTSAEQSLWEVLGWDEDSWLGEADAPASESKYWNELTDEERSAAEQLGYDQISWDS